MAVRPDRFSAVLFDFDGVLVDSEPIHCRAYLQTAAALGVPLTRERYYRELIGTDDVGAIRHLLQVAQLPVNQSTIQRFITDKTVRVQRLLAEGELRPLPGVLDLLANLAERKTPVAIYSAALQSELHVMLRSSKLHEFFTIVTAAEDVAVGKPDPGGYVLTAARLSETIRRPLPRERCLVVEDAPSVADRARHVGFAVLGVTTSKPANAWPSEIVTVPTLERNNLLEAKILE